MNSIRRKALAAAIAAALALAPASSAFARGGFGGGGFRSAPSFRSIGSSRSFSGWGSATRPSLKALPFAAPRASRTTTAPRLGGISGSRSGVSAQRGLYDSAKRNGTLFSSKTEASQAFKSRYAQDYSTKFAAEPSVRPSYIPSSALIGGRNVNIVYNPGLGGYGYFNSALGTWMLFDALADAALLDGAMTNRGYYWGGAPVYLSHGPGFLGLAFGVLVLFLILSAVLRIAARRRWRD